MKVSVVIPVFNEEKYIGQCLKSLMEQEEKADEIIVINNNCNDRTIEICKKFPVKIVREKKQGIISARNKGFNSAQFEIIARCDADVIAPKDWIKNIKQNFKKKDIVAVGGPCILYDLPLRRFSLKTTLFSDVYMGAAKKIYKSRVLAGANMALRKTAWDSIKDKAEIKDSKVHEDVDLSLLLGKIGQVFLDKKMVVATSIRRMKRKPHSFFVYYPIRLAKTYVRHSRNN
jgi:glycosyltransferase involved in cell wall biosynthesis